MTAQPEKRALRARRHLPRRARPSWPRQCRGALTDESTCALMPGGGRRRVCSHRRTRGAQRNADNMSAPADSACGRSRPAASADGTPHPVPVVKVASESRVVPASVPARTASESGPRDGPRLATGVWSYQSAATGIMMVTWARPRPASGMRAWQWQLPAASSAPGENGGGRAAHSVRARARGGDRDLRVASMPPGPAPPNVSLPPPRARARAASAGRVASCLRAS
jgi:hypothetical protein